MVTWAQIIKALVGIAVVGTLVFLVNRAGHKRIEERNQSE